jgi:uncharacterized protein YneR
MGMTLEESTEGLVKLEANGISAYIDRDLLGSIEQSGNIYVDYGADRFGMTGFSIAIKKNPSEKSDCC